MSASKSRQVIIAGTDARRAIYETLHDRIGFVADIIDKCPILEAALEVYFYGTSMGPSVRDSLLAYNVPSDVAQEIEDFVVDQLVSQVVDGFGRIYPARIYTFEILGKYGDVIITETNPLPQSLSEKARCKSFSRSTRSGRTMSTANID